MLPDVKQGDGRTLSGFGGAEVKRYQTSQKDHDPKVRSIEIGALTVAPKCLDTESR